MLVGMALLTVYAYRVREGFEIPKTAASQMCTYGPRSSAEVMLLSSSMCDWHWPRCDCVSERTKLPEKALA